LERGEVKVAIPTDDGITIALDFENGSKFLVTDVSPGKIGRRTMRTNPAVRFPRKRRRLGAHSNANSLEIANLLSDCRVAIAILVSDQMREALERVGIEVIVSLELLVDRALALFAVGALRDEKRFYETLSSEDELALPEGSDLKEFDG
jgi:predicted Fe-Mo cluster-binding NifX family protein